MKKRSVGTEGFGVIEIVIALAVLVMVGAGGMFIWNKFQEQNTPIDSFESCAAAGNPVLESYPEQCIANGETFVNPAQRVQPR